MAEVQTNTQTGELSQRFVEFVMMHAQNAALFLGQIPNPQTGEGEVNLDLARMFIDQLVDDSGEDTREPEHRRVDRFAEYADEFADGFRGGLAKWSRW